MAGNPNPSEVVTPIVPKEGYLIMEWVPTTGAYVVADVLYENQGDIAAALNALMVAANSQKYFVVAHIDILNKVHAPVIPA